MKRDRFNTYSEFLGEGNEEYIEISTKIFKKFLVLLKREKRELMDLWKKGLHSTEDPRFNPYERWWGFTDQKQVEGVWGPFTEKPGDMFGLEFETLDEMEADFRGYAEVDTYQVVVIPLRMEILFHYSDNGENDIPEGTRARFEKCLDEAIKSIPASKIEKYKGRIGAKRLGLLENALEDDETVESINMINEIMIKKYEQFTNEALKIGAYSQEWDSLTKEEIENLKGKMNLKKGDPLKFTGPRRMLYLAPNAFRVISGHDLEGAPLTFVEWATPDEIRKAVEPGASVGGRYSRKYVRELTDTELESFLIAKCEVPSDYKFKSGWVRSYGKIGGYYYITMFTYNPKYKAKIPEKLDSQKLKALAELVASSLGTDLKISGDEGDEGVRFYTWYISCRNLKGDSSVIAGPFGKKENAEKALEEMKKSVSPKGDLEKDLLQSWKVGIGKLAPEDWYVDKSRHHFSNEEFTRAVSKQFGIPLRSLVTLSKEQLLSRIGAKRLGLL